MERHYIYIIFTTILLYIVIAQYRFATPYHNKFDLNERLDPTHVKFDVNERLGPTHVKFDVNESLGPTHVKFDVNERLDPTHTPTVGVLIATNVIKSAPDTRFVEEVLDSLTFINAPRAPVVIAMDRTSKDNRKQDWIPSWVVNANRKQYEEDYLRNLHSLCYKQERPCTAVPTPKQSGLLDNIINAIPKLGDVDYVLVMQGDDPFIDHVPIFKVAAAMRAREMEYVRFSRWEISHQYSDPRNWTKNCPQEYDEQHEDMNFIRTLSWWDNTHLVPREYYFQEHILEHQNRMGYPEDFLQYLAYNCHEGHEGRIFEYGRDGDGPWTDHRNGRRGEDKPVLLDPAHSPTV